MYDLADLSTKQELTDLKRISTSSSVTADGDSVRIKKITHEYADGAIMVETTRALNPGSESTAPVAPPKLETTLSSGQFWMMVILVFIQVVMVTMVYGPIAAFLVELFPTRIRYTSMSLPYHIGNGIFGGLTPLIATSLYIASKSDAQPNGDPFVGLWYPMGVAALSFIIGMIFLSNRKKAEVTD
jgi:MHS family proline/betaine transporter-like MFS transporter